MTLRVSVVIPVLDGRATLGDCLVALGSQSLAKSEYEVIVCVDEATRDDSEAIALRAGVTVLRLTDHGVGRVRNAGIRAASAPWVAFTDADCLPTRSWLASLLAAVETAGTSGEAVLGAAGRTIGYRSETAAARFVDRSGGLSAERHLSHPRYPWAPPGNVLYARAALIAVGGFDGRYVTYEGCDLYTRLVAGAGGRMVYEPRAVVMHRHRVGWRAYTEQQIGYGKGYAQFLRAHADVAPWSVGREAGAWAALIPVAAHAALAPRGDGGLLARGSFIKRSAQRIGFVATYWSPRDRRRWRGAGTLGTPGTPGGALARKGLVARLSPWWTPWGATARLARVIRTPSDLPLLLRIGWFVVRVPSDMERLHLDAFLDGLAAAARPRASDPWSSRDRIARLRAPWLRLPHFRRRDTCYIRALTLYRFVDGGSHDVQLRVGAEWFDRPGGVLRGHAWVDIDGTVLEGPLESEAHARLQEIALRPSVAPLMRREPPPARGARRR